MEEQDKLVCFSYSAPSLMRQMGPIWCSASGIQVSSLVREMVLIQGEDDGGKGKVREKTPLRCKIFTVLSLKICLFSFFGILPVHTSSMTSQS